VRPRPIGPIEPLEQVRQRIRRDADAGIGHGHTHQSPSTRGHDRDAATVSGELDRVVEQDQQQPLQPSRITPDQHVARAAA